MDFLSEGCSCNFWEAFQQQKLAGEVLGNQY